MAIKTMSASTGSGSKFAAGWHECTIRSAEYGTFEKDDGTTKRLELGTTNIFTGITSPPLTK